MRVISKSRLQQFWSTPGREASEGPLRAWYTHVSNRMVMWESWSDVKADYAAASPVGNCIVFNIGGNKFRLVVRVFYASHKVFVLKILTHSEYDDVRWISECGCNSPPPKPTPGKLPATGLRRGRKRPGR